MWTLSRANVAGIQKTKTYWRGMLDINYWTWTGLCRKGRTWTSREIWVQGTCCAKWKWRAFNVISLDSVEQISALENQRISAISAHNILIISSLRNHKLTRFLWTLGCSIMKILCYKVSFFSLEIVSTLSILPEVQGNQCQHCDMDSPTYSWEVKKSWISVGCETEGGREAFYFLFRL